MKEKLYIKIARLLPERIVYWVVVMACNEVHRNIAHLKNRDEININTIVGYWYDRTK